MKTNYSVETSLPAYKSYKEEKKKQADEVLDAVSRGVNNNLQLSIYLNIPQSTVSGRVNDLIKEGKLEYSNEKVLFNNQLRKKIQLTSYWKVSYTQRELTQQKMF